MSEASVRPDPVDVKVRYQSGAYVAAAKGHRVSCTQSARFAAERLAEKVFGAAHGPVVEVSSDDRASSVWRIHPDQGPARAELLEWIDAATSKPDSDLSLVLWIAHPDGHTDWDAGWWDGEAWRLNESGGQVDGVVLFYASPEGPSA